MAVYKNEKKDGWIIKVTNPRTKKRTTIRVNPKTGMRFKTKAEAKEFELYYLKQKIDISMDLNALFERYIEDYLTLKPSSSADKLRSWYKSNIEPRIGKKRIVAITLTDMEKLARDMLSAGYSTNYTNKMTSNIKTVLNYGVTHGYIDSNPVLGYRPLKKIKRSDEVKYWTPKEFKLVVDSINDCYTDAHMDVEYARLMLSFAYFTGLRKGEIRALKWSNIDLFEDHGSIRIDYHINERNQRVLGRKNGNGYMLHMDKLTLELTKKIRNHFAKYDGFDANGYVFPSIMKGFNYPIGSHTPTRWIKELAEYNNLPNITFHGLRHSCVCYLATEVELSPYQVADRIGDTVGVVLQHYYQFFQESRIQVANIISNHRNEYFEALISNNEHSNDTENKEVNGKDIRYE